LGSEIVLMLLGAIFVAILMGVHIGVALGLASGLGVYLILGNVDAALSIISSTAYDAIRNQVFAVIPLFVLMGDIVAKSGAATDLFRLCDRGLSRLPGRLAVATVAGNAIFAAVTGVSVASAATFSRIAYPEMRRYGYDRKFALGAVAGSACLGMLIPPSILLIVWGILTEISIGALLLGFAKGMRGPQLMAAIYDAGKTTAPILFLLITASMYSRLLAFGGIVNIIQDFFNGLGVSPGVMVLIVALIWLLLGMLIDSVSIILLTVPIFVPLVIQSGFDPVAFAIFGILMIEAGLLTPPFGLLVYTVKGSVPDPEVTLAEIFLGSIPYLVMILIVAAMIWAFPMLATGLTTFM